MSTASDGWNTGEAYEIFMGRWSRQVARLFLNWLQPGPGAHWLEVGCGTGALTGAICRQANPAGVVACDPAPGLLAIARASSLDCPTAFHSAGADDLPRRNGGFDFVVSGLVLNFLPDPDGAVDSMRRRLRPGGTVAAYVWDYQEGMQFLRVFWDEVVDGDPAAAGLHEGRRFPLCRPEALTALLEQAGLSSVGLRPLEIKTTFEGFDAFWLPFLGGTGPAAAYVASLDPQRKAQLRSRLERRLHPSVDGSIRLTARAFGVRGLAPLDPGGEASTRAGSA